jgi:hypothetical protein
MKKKVIILSFSIALVVFTLGSLFYFLNNDYNQAAEAAPESSLYFSPAKSTVKLNTNFLLAAMINPGSNKVTAVELHITFDRQKMRLDSINVANSAFKTVLRAAEIDNNTGKASIILGVPATSPVVPVTSISKIADFNFYSLSSATDSPVVIAANSLAAALNETGNVILSRQSATVTIGSDQPVACQIMNSGAVIPDGYGAPYNTLTAAKELLMKVNCETTSAGISLGNGADNQYIWSKAHIWRKNAWQEISLTGTASPHGTSWLKGAATAQINLTSQEMSQKNNLIAFICQWTGTAWKCGCRDSACGQMYWQLQQFGL